MAQAKQVIVSLTTPSPVTKVDSVMSEQSPAPKKNQLSRAQQRKLENYIEALPHTDGIVQFTLSEATKNAITDLKLGMTLTKRMLSYASTVVERKFLPDRSRRQLRDKKGTRSIAPSWAAVILIYNEQVRFISKICHDLGTDFQHSQQLADLMTYMSSAGTDGKLPDAMPRAIKLPQA